MNSIWIFTAFLFNADTLINEPIEKKEFKSIEECVSYSRVLIENKENDKEKPPHLHYTASCIPKND